VDRDGLPLFWNEQPSAPRLGPTSGLFYYDGQRLPRPWKKPPLEWGAGPALYPHVPKGCGDQCQKIPLNAVRGCVVLFMLMNKGRESAIEEERKLKRRAILLLVSLLCIDFWLNSPSLQGATATGARFSVALEPETCP